MKPPIFECSTETRTATIKVSLKLFLEDWTVLPDLATWADDGDVIIDVDQFGAEKKIILKSKKKRKPALEL